MIMTRNQGIVLSIVALFLCSLLFFIIFSENGLTDLNILKKEKTELILENQRIAEKNQTLSIEIDRLKNDPDYIENVARRELGMIGKDEIILKPQNQSRRK